MRVLFWGTPEFATPALRALVGEGFDVVGVITQPDRAVGRSRSRLRPPPVKEIALEERIPVLQPDSARDPGLVTEIQQLEPDISVVVAYGQILPRRIIDLPRLGTLNIHASLLPKLRGAAPIEAAIRDGLTETGVSIMRMVPRLDAGPVLLRLRTPIAEDETGGELALRLSEMGALALIETLALVDIPGVDPTEEEQDENEATYAPKIDREMARIRWDAPAVEISRAIRAYDPRPGAFATHRGIDVKVFGARRMSVSAAETPGTILGIEDHGMTVSCGAHGEPRDAVCVSAIQPAGGKRLTPIEWERGRGVAVGERLS